MCPTSISNSVLKAKFADDSRIIALPGTEKNFVGYAAADLIILDEASRINNSLIAAIRPMLATSNGRLIALTTPAGKRGFFYEAWHSQSEAWLRVKVFAKDCSRISEEFLAEELKELGPARYSEEYGLEFRDNDEAVFPGTVIAAAFTAEVEPLWR